MSKIEEIYEAIEKTKETYEADNGINKDDVWEGIIQGLEMALDIISDLRYN